jgi:recombination protein RecT
MSEDEKQVATLPRWAETIGKTEDKFLEIIKDSGAEVSFAAESMFAFQILSKNEYSQKIATANLPSLRDAIINVAAIGLSLNPAMQEVEDKTLIKKDAP